MGSSGRTSSRSVKVVAGTTSPRPTFWARASHAPGVAGLGPKLRARRVKVPGPGKTPRARHGHGARWQTGTLPCTARYGGPRWVGYPARDWLIQPARTRE